jgi:hypothetical protein
MIQVLDPEQLVGAEEAESCDVDDRNQVVDVLREHLGRR